MSAPEREIEWEHFVCFRTADGQQLRGKVLEKVYSQPDPLSVAIAYTLQDESGRLWRVTMTQAFSVTPLDDA